MNETKSIILAAGVGSRLRPLTEKTPKCMLNIEGRPLIESHIRVHQSVGIERIVLITGHASNRLSRLPVKQVHNPDFASTNMVWTLFCARSELSGNVVVTYGDILYTPAVLKHLLRMEQDVAVVIDRQWEFYWRMRFDSPLEDAETLKIDEMGRIVDIGNVPVDITEIQGQYIGLMKFSPKGVEALCKVFDAAVDSGSLNGKPPRKAYMTDLLQGLIHAGVPVWPSFIDGDWVEIDTIKDYRLQLTRQRVKRILNDLARKEMNGQDESA